MGLDLTIVPYEWGSARVQWDFWLGYTRIRCGGARGFRDRLDTLDKQVGPKPLPPGTRFDWYEDDGLVQRDTDPYGEPLTYMLASELLQVNPPATECGKRAWAYLAALPPSTPVILWWH